MSLNTIYVVIASVVASFFSTVAAAADPAASANFSPFNPTGGFSSLLFLGGFMVLFYFMLWRPQSKRAKDQQDLLTNIAVGDEVVSSGGILGQVTAILQDYIILNIADNLSIKLQKNAIVSVLPKGTLKAIES